MSLTKVLMFFFAFLLGVGVSTFIFFLRRKRSVFSDSLLKRILSFMSENASYYPSMLNMERTVRILLSDLAKLPGVRSLRLICLEEEGARDFVSGFFVRDPILLKELRKLLSYREEDSVGFGLNNPLFSFLGISKKFYRKYDGRAFVLPLPYRNIDYVLLVFFDRFSFSFDLKRILMYYKRQIFLFVYFHDYLKKSKDAFELLDQVFLKSPIAMTVTDSNGKIKKANARFYSFFGRGVSRMRDVLDEDFFNALRQGRSYEKEVHYERFILKVYSHPVYDQKGEVDGAVFSVIDQSVQYLLYKKLESSEERYRTLIKKLPIGLVIIDRIGDIYFVNDNFLYSLGLEDASQVDDKNLIEFFELDEEELQEIVFGADREESRYYKFYSRPEYESRIFSVNFRKVFMGDEEFFEAVCQDISLERALYSELEAKSKILDEELRTAQVVQEHILAIPPIYNAGVRFETFYKPSSELGGDFYDILTIDENHLGVLIADVSGHGVSAALITSMLKILVEFSPRDPHKLEEMTNYLNNGLLKIMPEDHFITLFYAVIDTKNHTLDYINCGHPYPIILNEKTKELTILEGMGFPIGSFSKSIPDMSVRGVALPENCKILFYTDGIFNFKIGDSHLNVEELSQRFKNVLSERSKEVLSSLYIEISGQSEKIVDDDVSMLMLTVNRELSYKNYLSIPSNVLEIDFAIVKIMEEIKKKLKMGDEDEWKLYTALYEAMINAVEHGNRFNVQKRVTVIYRIFQNKVLFKVRDEGQGFSEKNVPNPLDQENLLKSSGRGIFMMKKLTSRVKYNKKGNELTMLIEIKGR